MRSHVRCQGPARRSGAWIVVRRIVLHRSTNRSPSGLAPAAPRDDRQGPTGVRALSDGPLVDDHPGNASARNHRTHAKAKRLPRPRCCARGLGPARGRESDNRRDLRLDQVPRARARAGERVVGDLGHGAPQLGPARGRESGPRHGAPRCAGDRARAAGGHVAVPRLSPCPRRRSSCGQARGERESGWVGGSAGRRRHRPGRARVAAAAKTTAPRPGALDGIGGHSA